MNQSLALMFFFFFPTEATKVLCITLLISLKKYEHHNK